MYERVAPTHVGHIVAEPEHAAVQKPLSPGFAVIGISQVVAMTWLEEFRPPRHD